MGSTIWIGLVDIFEVKKCVEITRKKKKKRGDYTLSIYQFIKKKKKGFGKINLSLFCLLTLTKKEKNW